MPADDKEYEYEYESPEDDPTLDDGESPESDAANELVDDSASTLDGDEPETARVSSEAPPDAESWTSPPPRDRRIADDMGDAVGVTGAGDGPPLAPGAVKLPIDGEQECSPQRIAVELKKIEAEVRKLLEDRDPKRKRRLAGTRRWRELEEDLIALRYSNRIDEPTLETLQRLVQRRHYLFNRLRFLALTRPTWNS